MNVKICGTTARGEIEAIPSKSYAHRIAICSFFAKNPITTTCGDFSSKDIIATERCLNQLNKGEKVLDCTESGSTLRFLIPLVASLGGEYILNGQGKLMSRPNKELADALIGHGVTVEQTDCVKVKGKLTGGEFRLRGDISSQYVSGLLMALPSLKEDSKIVLTTPLASSSYVDITIEVLEKFNVKIERTDYGYFIRGNQKYCGLAKAEGDWSNGAFFLSLGALAGDVTLFGLNPDSVQGDKVIMDVLEKAGAKVSAENGGIRVQKSQLNCFTLDAENCPDLVPIVSVLGAFAKGTTVIEHVERLKIKESDRILTTIDMLEKFGIKAESDGKTLTIYGGKPKSAVADSHNDHRIAMSIAVMATACEGQSVLTDAKAVEKSYPSFFEHLTKVGGRVEYD
ncbi:MAG: 3-phosphoshikimate 1-carboxyvinyltransferase [Clostridia bacterium]|nr:3-phosphoshikimate 1-carboxyvinyltransferase [Clostridia bacterium]